MDSIAQIRSDALSGTDYASYVYLLRTEIMIGITRLGSDRFLIVIIPAGTLGSPIRKIHTFDEMMAVVVKLFGC